eukprot:TRINITY_DN3010_c1_g1_i1.p1 TRINITY_DN3010_c1_g1~~TRINITY_DN3010_c1_g1_i1.p1  ORF type:complete len:882 (+),score=139.27 TRINITY_DN3010_c1_g1_i1:346-2991(+)
MNAIRKIEGLDELFNLVDLNLSDNEISLIENLVIFYLPYSCQEHLTKLERLNLSGNKIATLGTTLPSLLSLKVLKLSRNRVSDPKELPKLAGIMKLSNLSINANPVTELPNVPEYCVFHIKTLEVFNDLRVTEVFRKRASEIFSPTSTNEHSPAKLKREVLKSCGSLNRTQHPTNYGSRNDRLGKANTASVKKNLTKSFVEVENISVPCSAFEIFEDSTEDLPTKTSVRKVEDPKDLVKQTRRRLRQALNKVVAQRENAAKIKSEAQQLKEILKVKNSHLAILRKQMAEQSVESCLSDSEGFYVEEEKASSQELKDLEAELKAKESKHVEILQEMEETRVEISKLEEEMQARKQGKKAGVSKSVLGKENDYGVTPRFSKGKKLHAVTYCEITDSSQSENELSIELKPSVSIQQKIFEDIHGFLLPLLKNGKAVYTEKSVWGAAINKGEKDELINNAKGFHEWIQLALPLIKDNLCFKYSPPSQIINRKEKEDLQAKLNVHKDELNEKYKQEQLLKARIAELEAELKTNCIGLSKVNEEAVKKSRSCSLSNGIRSTLKVLQTLEDERVKCKVEGYESEIEALMKENRRLKEKMEACVDPEFIRGVVSRAAKLHNYIADKFNKAKVELNPCEQKKQWEIVDSFTRQARAYIRNAEKNEQSMNKLKNAKGKFMEYIEKEVTELTKSWNLMEEERGKLRTVMKKFSAKAECGYKNKKERIEELENKKLIALEGVEQLVFKEDEVKREVEIYEKRLKSLKETIDRLLSDKDKLTKEVEELEKYGKWIKERKITLKELNDEIFEHEYILEKHKKKIGKCKAKLVVLKSELSSIQKSADSPQFCLSLFSLQTQHQQQQQQSIAIFCKQIKIESAQTYPWRTFQCQEQT